MCSRDKPSADSFAAIHLAALCLCLLALCELASGWQYSRLRDRASQPPESRTFSGYPDPQDHEQEFALPKLAGASDWAGLLLPLSLPCLLERACSPAPQLPPPRPA